MTTDSGKWAASSLKGLLASHGVSLIALRYSSAPAPCTQRANQVMSPVKRERGREKDSEREREHGVSLIAFRYSSAPAPCNQRRVRRERKREREGVGERKREREVQRDRERLVQYGCRVWGIKSRDHGVWFRFTAIIRHKMHHGPLYKAHNGS